jgi:hypothetical protein
VAKAKKAKKVKKENKSAPFTLPPAQPWISMQKGLRIVGLASIVMAILTAWEVVPVKGWLEGILWGLFFGGLIWGIFFGMLLFNRFIRR